MKALKSQKGNAGVQRITARSAAGEVVVFKLPHDARNTHASLEEILKWMAEGNTAYIVLDLSGPMLASTQLGPAVAIRNAAKSRGGSVRLVINSEYCLGVLKQCQLAQLFDIYTSIDAACDDPWDR